MNPDYSPQQIVSRLGINRRDWEHLKKTCPPPRNLATLDDPRFDEWARRDISGLLIQNMRVRRGLTMAIAPPPKKKDKDDTFILRQALLRLKLVSVIYSGAVIGRDRDGYYTLIGEGVYEILGKKRQAAYRWLKDKADELRAASRQKAA